MFFKKILLLPEHQLQKLITLAAVLIACQVIYIQHGWINDDSVLYFEMARLFSIGEFKQGFTLFNWPLYPTLISAVHVITQFSIQSSAQILDVFFFGLTAYSFISLIRLAGGNQLTMLCGGFLLLSSPYIVGDVLPMLLRDQGFWATFLASLVYFIQYYRHKKLSDALRWQVCIMLCVLFRIEAITFLVGLPFILFLQAKLPFKQRLADTVSANFLSIIALFLIVLTLITLPNIHLSDFGRLQESVTVFPRVLGDITQNFYAKTNTMSEDILGRGFADYGMLGVVIGFASILIFKSINLITWPVAGLFALNHFTQPNKQQMQTDARRILYWSCVLACINACVIMASVFILSGRYIIVLGLLLLIFAAFQLATLIEKLQSKQLISPWKRISFFILVLLITLFAIKNVWPKRAGYNFEQEVVSYLKQQQVANDKVFFVTPRSRYFAGAPYAGRGYEYWDYTQKAIADGTIYEYDYLAINLDIDEQFAARKKFLDEKLPQYKLVKEFYGLRAKKKMMLFQKK
jgi:hypothetical protein